MKNSVLYFIFGLLAFMIPQFASAASLIPASTLTGLGTDLTDTFSAGIAWAYPIMLTFVGGIAGFMLVRRLIKMAASG